MKAGGKIAAIGVTTALLGGVFFSSAHAAGRYCTGAVLRNGGWTHIDPPEFPGSTNQFTGPVADTMSFDISESDPRTIFIANNEVVQRSTDGGCSWKPVFQLDVTINATAPGAYCAEDKHAETRRLCRISSIDIGPTPATSDRVYVQVQTIPTGTGQTSSYSVYSNAAHGITWVFYSEDRGSTWSLVNEGPAEPRAGFGDLVIHPRDPRIVYAVRHTSDISTYSFNVAISDQGYLTTSGDGGDTWELVGPLPGSTGLTINPYDPADLWIIDRTIGLHHSTDGGRSWVKVDAPFGSISNGAFFFGRRATAVAAADNERRIYFTSDLKEWSETTISNKINNRRVSGEFELAFGGTVRDLFVANAYEGWIGRLDPSTGSLTLLDVVTEEEESNEGAVHGRENDLQFGLTRAAGRIALMRGCHNDLTCSYVATYKGRGT